MCNKTWSKGYAFITTSKENRTSEFKRILKEKVFAQTERQFKISNFIFLDSLPRVANGKVSRSLLNCLLNKLPHQI